MKRRWPRAMAIVRRRRVGPRGHRAYIYAIFDPSVPGAPIPFYVGQTSMPHARMVAHFGPRCHNAALADYVADLKVRGVMPKFQVLAIVHATDGDRVERALIRRMLSAGQPLVNRAHVDRTRT